MKRKVRNLDENRDKAKGKNKEVKGKRNKKKK